MSTTSRGSTPGIDALVGNNRARATGAYPGSGHGEPRTRVAVVPCMDARIDVFAALGLDPGDAHVIRSLLLSQRLLGTREVMLIHHTDCGMLKFRDDELKQRLEAETGIKPPFALESFGDLDTDVRQSMARVRRSPFLASTEAVRGFVYEVHSGQLREVT